MYSLLVLSLAVLGASAAPCGVSIAAVSNNCCQGPTVVGQTPVIQNPTSYLPSYIPSTSVSQSCHCLKTSVRPQIRTEVISVPQVDRLVRIVPSPVVEAVSVNMGGSTRSAALPTCGINTPVSGTVVDGVSGVVSGSYPFVSQGVQEVVAPRIVAQEVLATSYPRIVSQAVPTIVADASQGVLSGSYQGFGGVFNSGIVGSNVCV